jgi:hypothetical protein
MFPSVNATYWEEEQESFLGSGNILNLVWMNTAQFAYMCTFIKKVFKINVHIQRDTHNTS